MLMYDLIHTILTKLLTVLPQQGKEREQKLLLYTKIHVYHREKRIAVVTIEIRLLVTSDSY